MILQSRHLILVGALLALGLILGGMAHSMGYRARLVQQARDRTVLGTTSFARAVADWVRDENPETMSRVVNLMLLGSSLWVRVVSEGETLIDRSVDAFSEIPQTPGALTEDDSAHARLDRRNGTWYFDTVAAIPHEPARSGANHVRVAADVSFLQGQLAIRNLWIVGGVAATWFVVAGALAGIVFTLAKRGTISLAAWAGHESDENASSELIRHGSLTINTVTMEVRVLDHEVHLTPKQYALLSLLVREEGKVFSDTEIIAEIWPDSPYADANDIRQCVYRLRRRLEKALEGADKMVVTVKGFGYRFDAGVIDPEGGEG